MYNYLCAEKEVNFKAEIMSLKIQLQLSYDHDLDTVSSLIYCQYTGRTFRYLPSKQRKYFYDILNVLLGELRFCVHNQG